MRRWVVKKNVALLIFILELSPDVSNFLYIRFHRVRLSQEDPFYFVFTTHYFEISLICLQLGDVVGLKRVLSKMEAVGVALDGLTCISLAKSCEDGGLSQAAIHFLDRAEGMGVDLSEHVGDSADRPKKAIQWWKKKNRRL